MRVILFFNEFNTKIENYSSLMKIVPQLSQYLWKNSTIVFLPAKANFRNDEEKGTRYAQLIYFNLPKSAGTLQFDQSGSTGKKRFAEMLVYTLIAYRIFFVTLPY
jgi:hypothetical protein